MPSFIQEPDQPKVSVVLLTYNHEPYIVEAIDSVLLQETDFPFELVIVEDCSTDRTREIITEYQARNPGIISLVLAESNQNDFRAWAQAIVQARGQYVALLEGDDYWTSPHKLQKQAGFLDENPDCTICFHNVKIVSQDKDRPPEDYNDSDQKLLTTTEDLWHRNFLATCSVVLRKGVVTEIPDWFHEMRFGDWPLHIIYSEHGHIGYLPETMGVYRLHDKGLFSSISPSRQLEGVLSFYDKMSTIYGTRYGALIAEARIRHGRLLAQAYHGEDNLPAFNRTMARLFTWSPRHFLGHLYQTLPMLSRLIVSRIRKRVGLRNSKVDVR
jgi:glycosyltransferase involved in cell wall biosynthesis